MLRVGASVRWQSRLQEDIQRRCQCSRGCLARGCDIAMSMINRTACYSAVPIQFSPYQPERQCMESSLLKESKAARLAHLSPPSSPSVLVQRRLRWAKGQVQQENSLQCSVPYDATGVLSLHPGVLGVGATATLPISCSEVPIRGSFGTVCVSSFPTV